MGRRKRDSRRTAPQAAADRAADDLARELGKALRLARQQRGLTQAAAAQLAGMTQSTWSYLELGGDGRGTFATWNRAAMAVGGRLRGYLQEVSAASLPRDSVHLRGQELVLRISAGGGWHGLPEVPLGRDARTSRMGDVVLRRHYEYALVELIDFFPDVGAAGRDWPRRLEALERYAIARMGDDVVPRVSGLWIVRATRRNRQLVNDHRHFFRALLPGSSVAWLAALKDRDAPMPGEAGLAWVSVPGDRLFPARLGSR